MTALIKTIIAAVIGLIGSIGNPEVDQVSAEVNRVQEQEINSCSNYPPLKCLHNSKNSCVWLNLSSAS